MGEITKPYGTLSISTQLLLDTVKGETEADRRLYSASDTFGDKVTKAFVHNLQGMARQFYLLILPLTRLVVF